MQSEQRYPRFKRSHFCQILYETVKRYSSEIIYTKNVTKCLDVLSKRNESFNAVGCTAARGKALSLRQIRQRSF